MKVHQLVMDMETAIAQERVRAMGIGVVPIAINVLQTILAPIVPPVCLPFSFSFYFFTTVGERERKGEKEDSTCFTIF